MQKNEAKSLVKELKKKANAHFAFAPNSGEPFLLVGRRPWTIALVKKQSEDQAGVVYRNGALYVGELLRENRQLVLVVDEGRSKGNISTKKAILGMRTLRKTMRGLGVASPLLQTLTFQIGDESESDVAEDEPVDLGPLLDGWDGLLDRVEDRLGRVRAGEALPGNRTPEEMLAKLGQITREVRDDMKLAQDRLDAPPGGVDGERFMGCRRRVDALLDALVEGRATKNEAWAQDYSPVTPLDQPEDLPERFAPMLDELNETLTSGGLSAKELSSRAYDVAQTCLEAHKKLKGKFWQNKKRKRQIAALIELQHQAMAIADAVLVEGAVHERGERILELLSDADNVGRAATGINHAQVISDREGTVRYIAKTSAHDDHDKIKEFGAEVVSSTVSDLLSVKLGMPQMVSRTTGTVLDVGGQNQMMVVQDAWDARGDLADQAYHMLEVAGTRVKVTLPEAETLATGGGEEYAKKLLRRAGVEDSDENARELLEKADPGRTNWRETQWSPLPVDPAHLAEDVANTALVDMILGQRDHRQGKEDNVMVVREGGAPRVKPIDFGMALMTIESDVGEDFGAWTDLAAAGVPFPEEQLERLLALDPGILVGSARKAGEHLATTSGLEDIAPDEGQLVKLELNIRIMQLAVEKAQERELALSPRDLASIMEQEGWDVHAGLKAAWRDDPEHWMDQVEPLLRTFSDSLDSWADDVEAIQARRAALDLAFDAFYVAVERIESGEEVDDAKQLSDRVEAAIESARGAASRFADHRAIDVIEKRMPLLRVRARLE